MTVISFVASEKYRQEDAEIYNQMCQHLKRYGDVDTEHLKVPGVLVAEVTHPSTSVGYDIGKIIEGNNLNWISTHDQKRILCLYRSRDEEFLKRMSKLGNPILVNSGLNLREYSSIEEARIHIDDFFKNKRKQKLSLL